MGALIKKTELGAQEGAVRPLYAAAEGARQPAAAPPPAPASAAPPTAGTPPAEAAGPGVVDRHARLLNRMITELVAERQRLLTELRPDLLRLALQIASAIIGYESTANPALIEHTLTQALQQLHFASRVVVRVHPEDLAYVQERPDLFQTHSGEVEFVADQSVERGGCLLQSDRGGIDSTIATQIRSLTEQLLEQGESA